MTLGPINGGGGGGGGGGLSFPLADNVSGVFGTTAPFSVTAIVNGAVNRAVYTAPTSTNVFIITSEANKAYDFLGVNPGITNPLLILTSANQAHNEFSYFSISNSRTLGFAVTDGDDVDGTPRNAKGLDLLFSAGQGGTLGGLGGNVRFVSGNPQFGNQDGGDVLFLLGQGSGTGQQGCFTVNTGDFRIKLKSNFKIIASINNHYASLVHTGANVVYSTDFGDHQFTGNVAITAAGKGLQIKGGANATAGVATLGIGGTASVATTAVTANSQIHLSNQNPGGTPGQLFINGKTPGASFVISSESNLDTSDVFWTIIELT